MPFPATLWSKPKIIFFTDFDGTITLRDTNDYLTDHHGFGYAKRRQANLDTLSGKRPTRDSFREMIESWDFSFPEGLSLVLDNIQLDPHFVTFFDWALENDVPVVVLSLGLTPIIKALLTHLLGEEKASKIEIVANAPVKKPPINDLNTKGGYTIQYRDDSHHGHDKSITIRPYAEAIAKMPVSEQPTLLYAGDGCSDLSAARETDLLFAKRGQDLVKYCDREGVPYVLFDDWSDISSKTKDIFESRTESRRIAREAEKVAQRHPGQTVRMPVGTPARAEMVN